MENLLDISFEAIRYFLSVAKYGSISKAANVLKISQSALSQSMKNLEEHLGITLFNRNTRGVILTEEGKVLFEEAREGEKFFRKAIVNAKQNANFRLSGTFKISCSRAVFDFCFKFHMQNILKAFPNLNIEFVKHFLEQDVVKALQNEELDLENLLRQQFPLDDIIPIAKGVNGADIKQIVKNPLGYECGIILWEAKNAKWQKTWIDKFIVDIQNAKAKRRSVAREERKTTIRYV